MEEIHILRLNEDCLLEIMKYIIRNCASSGATSKEEKYADLINFVLSDKRFFEVLRSYHADIYDDLQFVFLALQHIVNLDFTEIHMQLKNTSSKWRGIYWRSSASAIQENNNLSEIHMHYTPESYCSEFLDEFELIKRALQGYSLDSLPHLGSVERLFLDVRMDAEALVQCCRSNPGLKRLSLLNPEMYGRLSDIVPHCNNLESLTFKVKPEVDVDEYSLLAKMPKLNELTIKGDLERRSLKKLFEALRRWRTSNCKYLTLTIEDSLLNYEETSVLAGVNGLKYLTCGCLSSQSIEPLKNAQYLLELRLNKNFDINEIFEVIRDIQTNSIVLNSSCQEIHIRFQRNSGMPFEIIFSDVCSDFALAFLIKLTSAPSLTTQELICTDEIDTPEKRKSATMVSLRILFCHVSDLRNVEILGVLMNLTASKMKTDQSHPDTYSHSLRNLFIEFAKAGRIGLQSLVLKGNAITTYDAAELARLTSIRFLKFSLFNERNPIRHFVDLEIFRMFIKLQIDRISERVLKLLNNCQANSFISIDSDQFQLIFQKKEKTLIITVKNYEIDFIPAAVLKYIDYLQIDIWEQTGSLNTFLDTLATSPTNTLLGLTLRNHMTFEDIAKVREIQTLRELECHLTNTTGIELLAQLNDLEALTVTSDNNGSLISLFRQLAEKKDVKLQYLAFPGEKLSPEEITQVSRIQSLKRLECGIWDPTDSDSLTRLAGSDIEKLTLFSDLTNPLEHLFAAFAANELSRLQYLGVRGRHIRIEEIAEISRIKSLKGLESGYSKAGQAIIKTKGDLEGILKYLALTMKTLQKLELCYYVGSTEFKYLAQIKALESLKCSFDDNQGIELLAEANNLEELTIHDSNSSLNGLFGALETLQNLNKLHLRNSFCNPEEFREITRLKSLKNLHINVVYRTTDIDLLQLTKLTELESLDLLNIKNISYECLQIIEACKKLNLVRFDRYSHIMKNFIGEVYTILRSVRDPEVQGPLQLKFVVESDGTSFPYFPLEDIDEEYLKVSFSLGESLDTK